MDETAVKIVTTQTSMTETEARKCLELNGNDYLKVIREHYKIEPPATNTPKPTLNQEIYSQIRKKIAISNDNRKI